MQSKLRRPNEPCRALPPHHWPRLRALRDVCQLNEHLLGVLSTAAASGAPSTLGLLTQNSELWCSLDSSSRSRAAQIPILLLDLKFQDETWWNGIVRAASCRSTYEVSAEQGVDPWLTEFTRQALMLAWPSVREDRASAALLFGMSEPVAAIIGALAPQQVDHVSVHHSRAIRVRWAEFPVFWRKLLMAAQADDIQTLRDLHLYGLQLLGGEMLRAREMRCGSPSRPGRRAGFILN